MLLKTTLLIFLIFPQFVNSYNFLVINPVFAYSHYKNLCEFANTLAEAGHNVTMLQYYHVFLPAVENVKKHEKIEIIKYFPENFNEVEAALDSRDLWDSMLVTNAFFVSRLFMNVMMNAIANTTRQLLNDSEFLTTLEARNFDAVVTEPFDTTGLAISHLINVKTIIPCLAAVRLASIERVFGQPSQLGYVPGAGSTIPPVAGFLDRLNDIYVHYFGDKAIDTFLDAQSELHSEIPGKFVPHWSKILERCPLFFVNSNPYLDFAVPTTRNLVAVGGFTMDLKNKYIDISLPEGYENILKTRDTSVFISFGSIAKSEEMPDSFKSGLISMFKMLPEITFIWKYENENDVELKSKLPSNVHIRKWVPQPALLADKRVKLFITHGGLTSTMEVAYCGKPALMVPLVAEQPQNAEMLARHGGAKVLDRFDLKNGEKLARIVDEMTTNAIYQEKASYLANILHSPPIDPKEILVKNVEFAVKFNDFKAMVPEISRIGFVEFYYLDAYFFIAFVIFSFLLIVYKLLKNILKRFVKTKGMLKSKNE